MIVGILIVCFNANKPSEQCRLTFEIRIGDPVDYDSSPSAAAIDDLNNDGQLDIIVANPGTHNIGIFFGNNDGTFETQRTYSTGFLSKPYSVIVGKFDDDNQLDIITANYGSNSIGILRGRGNKTFENVFYHSLGSSRPRTAATADLNNDGCLDIVVTYYDISSIGILLGYGDASFSNQTIYSTGYDSHPYFVVAIDLNEDNCFDIITSNSGTNNIAIFLGYGNGSFTFPKLYSTGFNSHPAAVTTGDLNGDHQLDIIVSNYGTSTIGVLLGYGDGVFSKMKISFTNSELRPYYITMGDFNKDNILDVAVVSVNNNSILILRGLGDGSFINDQIYYSTVGSTPIFVIVGDFNNDNRLDLAMVNNATNSITIFERYVMKTFTNQTIYSTGSYSYPNFVVTADFNNDNFLDVAVTAHGINTIGIFLGKNDGTLQNPIRFSTGNYSRPVGLALGHFNTDGLLYMAVVDGGSNRVGIFLGHGDGTFDLHEFLSTGEDSFPLSVSVGDFNNDSILNIAVANRGAKYVGIFLGNGDGTFQTSKNISTGHNSFPSFVNSGDFNNDHILDIAVAHRETHYISIHLGYGNGSFIAKEIYQTGVDSFPFYIALVDFNNDRLLDIAVVNYLGNNIGILLGYGNGSFNVMKAYSMIAGSKPTSLVYGDFNNDTFIDLAVSNAGANSIALLFGYGNGSFGMLASYSTGSGSGPYWITSGYFNRDLWLDLVIANQDGDSIGIILGLDNVDVARQSSYSSGSGSHPYTIVTSDFNNDSILDLLIVNSGYDNVSIRFGYGNGTFSNEVTYPAVANSRPQFTTVADFNDDHQMDIVIVNTRTDSITIAYGNNNGSFSNQTIYQMVDGSRPCFAATNDLNNDNRLDLVILNEGTNTIGVFLSFDYATFKKQKLYSTEVFSAPVWLAVADFNNDSFLDVAVANEGSQNVGILLGHDDGTFATLDTFATGSHAGTWSVAIGDFNNDHIIDLAVANYLNNSIGILLGYGNGSFASQITFDTGQASTPYSVAVGDFNEDNALDIAVSNTGADNVGIFLGYGNGTFVAQRKLSTGYRSGVCSVAVTDFNNDHILDIAVVNWLRNDIGIFLGYGNAMFTEQKTFSTGSNADTWSLAVGDFNSDGMIDIVVANRNHSNIGIFLGHGNGNFENQTTFSTGDGSKPSMVQISDLNDDNRLDVIVANFGSNDVTIFFGYGDGSFTEPMIFDTGSGSQPQAVAIGNFDNDKRSDIVVANTRDGSVMVLLRDSSQLFLTMKSYETGYGSNPQSIAIGDFNQDHHSDIAVANYGVSTIGIFIGYGNGDLMEQKTYTMEHGSKPRSIVIGHFNNDTCLDIVVANAGTNNIVILLGNGDGTFSNLNIYSTGDFPSSPYALAASDFNNDTYLDITVANADPQNILVLYGYGNGSFRNSESFLLGYGSRPYSVTVGDFDRDNMMDIAVANYGTNSVDILLRRCNIS